MKILRYFFILVCTLYIAHFSTQHSFASSVTPFVPFSEEGNPDEEYHFGELFPLFRYIRPRALEIYENKDRSRNYEGLIACPGGDRRDKDCSVDTNSGTEIDGCDGGEVDYCSKTLTGIGGVAQTKRSGPNGSCTAKRIKNQGVVSGTCKYEQVPSVAEKIKGTDFSMNETLTFPKIQSGSLYYINRGDPSNPITSGTAYLSMQQGDLVINQLLVLKRARITKSTVAETGEWPLGWVDWGYQVQVDDDQNPSTPTVTKTLLEIHDSLPDQISASGLGIMQAQDKFFMSGANLDSIVDKSQAKQYIIDAVRSELAKNNPDQWAIDLTNVPPYPPSFRQGFVRPSICVRDICCPGGRCKDEPEGIKRSLHYDTSISQAFGGAIDQLFMSYPLQEAANIFHEVAIKNPLIRFAGSADIPAIPSKIKERLNNEMLSSSECLKYIPWGNWLGFGTHIDYLDSGDFLDPAKKCPEYEIAPDMVKENAAAFSNSPFSAILKLIWGDKEDELDPVKKHIITIPEALAQSIQEIQQPYYDTRDTLIELEAVKETNSLMSNTIDNEADYLQAGQTSIAANSKRLLPYYSCDDTMFSSQLDTSIQDYATGSRVGCFDTKNVPEGKCDGQLFAKLLEAGDYQDPSPKGLEYFNTYVKPNITAELMNTYAAAEKETGVPCEVLAGIHFVEASNSPDGSLVSGRKIGTPEPDAGGKVFRSLLETAKYAGDHLNGKVGGKIKDVKSLITALSRYNGGGNSNCQQGYPYPIPYNGCPRKFEGEDDPYPTSFLDGKHDNMYLLYCADHTACKPQVFERPGSFTVALAVYQNMTKSGYSNTTLPSPTPTPNPQLPAGTNNQSNTVFFPKSCGEGSISTALGCLPYTRDAFVSTILSFIVGIAGAIALIVMLIATVQFITASGDAKKLQSAKELFMSALVGLLFLIFSVSLLRIVAGDIIKLPGF